MSRRIDSAHISAQKAPTRRAVRQYLQRLHRLGVQGLPRYQGTTDSPVAVPEALGEGLPREQRIELLEDLAKKVRACTRCAELVGSRTQTVFGTGDPEARLCFVGEGPGAEEDRQGVPFVGRAGQLLDKILEACKLTRDQVYILNVVKCRPPGNRNPTAEEAANCFPFLSAQLEIIRPEYICCLGRVAADTMLGETARNASSLKQIRGKFHPWRWAKLVVTYHPAYLLRNPAAKRDTWADMKMLMRAMGAEVK